MEMNENMESEVKTAGQTWACETWNDDDKYLTTFLGLR